MQLINNRLFSDTLASPLDATALTSKRRDFLRILGAGASIATLGGLVGCGSDGVAATIPTELERLRGLLAQDAAFWANIERGFILNPGVFYGDTGTAGSMPVSTLQVFDQENREQARTAASGYSNLRAERERIAPGFGVDPDELALSNSATSGMCHVMYGLQWQPGDVIVTTNQEHGSGNGIMTVLVDRYGVEISRVAMPTGAGVTPNVYEPLFDDHITALKRQGKRVRALFWSSPLQPTGIYVPIDRMMNVVRKHELISIVDGAHIPGQMHLDFSALGVDFMAGSGHKWQCGPGSTGILVVRNKLSGANSMPLPRLFPVHSTGYFTKPREQERVDVAGGLVSCGQVHIPMFRAFANVCEMWDQVGRAKIQTYVQTIALYLKQKIAEKWGTEALHSSLDPALLTGMTAFMPFINPADRHNTQKFTQFRSRLLTEYPTRIVVAGGGINVTPDPVPQVACRIHTHIYIDVAEIDALVDSMWDLANKMA